MYTTQFHSRITKSNKDLNEKLVEYETKASLNDSSALPLKYTVERVQKELDNVESHNTWLEKELAERNTHISQLVSKRSQELMAVRRELTIASAAKDDSAEEVNRLEEDNKILQQRLEQTYKDLHEQRHLGTRAAEAAEASIQADRRLIEKQKEQLDREKARNDRLATEMETLRKTANDAAMDLDDKIASVRAEVETEMQTVLRDQQTAHKAKVAELRKQLQEANRLRIQVEDGMLSPRSKARKESQSRLSLTADGEPVGLTEVYTRLQKTEDALEEKTKENEELKLTLDKINADIEAKTPLIVRQRKEGAMAKQQLIEVSDRLRDAVSNAKTAKRESDELRLMLATLQKDKAVATEEAQFLAKQVQELLQAQQGGEIPETGVSSTATMQQQNQRLAREHIRLAREVTTLKEKLSGDVTAAKLQRTERELEMLRDEQTKQVSLVEQIVRQRDLYQAMVETYKSSPTSASDLTATQSVVAHKDKELKTMAEKQKQLEEEAAKAKSNLVVANVEIRGLNERTSRYEEHTANLTSSLETLRTELSATNGRAARAEVDSTYYKDRCVRVEGQLDRSKAEVERLQQSKAQIQSLNNDLQEQVATATSDVTRLESEVRQAERKVRLAEAQTETAKSAELRLSAEVNQLRTELSRQGSLVETVQRMEATLTAQSEADKEGLKSKAEQLSQVLDQERSKNAVQIENLQNRVSELESELKDSASKREKAVAIAEQAQQTVSAMKLAKDELEKKIESLGSELSTANEQLAAGGTDELLRTQMASLTEELGKAKAEATKALERAKNFESLNAASDESLRDLTTNSLAVKKSQDKQIEELKRSIESAQKVGIARQEAVVELTKDLSAQRAEQAKAVAELQSQITVMTQEVKNAKAEAEASTKRATNAAGEIEQFQSEATNAKVRTGVSTCATGCPTRFILASFSNECFVLLFLSMLDVVGMLVLTHHAQILTPMIPLLSSRSHVSVGRRTTRESWSFTLLPDQSFGRYETNFSLNKARDVLLKTIMAV